MQQKKNGVHKTSSIDLLWTKGVMNEQIYRFMNGKLLNLINVIKSMSSLVETLPDMVSVCALQWINIIFVNIDVIIPMVIPIQ